MGNVFSHLMVSWLRLFLTFMGVLPKKNCTCPVSKETPTNYYINGKVMNVEFDEIMFFFADCFPQAAGTLNAKTTN